MKFEAKKRGKKNESFQSWTFGASLNIFGKAKIYEVNFA